MKSFEEWTKERLQAPEGFNFDFEDGKLKLDYLHTEGERKMQSFLNEVLRKEYDHYVAANTK